MWPPASTSDFTVIKRSLGMKLLEARVVKVPEWQSLDVSDKPMAETIEIQNAIFSCDIPENPADAVIEVEPHIPWAEEHFLERVGGVPLNPPPSHVNWPFAQKGNDEHQKDEKFSHTYPERMWPKQAGPNCAHSLSGYPSHLIEGGLQHVGIRFAYGDLGDVVEQLFRSPQTRQAFLPIWFPEDTGAVHGERVPCSLGYHFLIREGYLHVTYFIRSVDFIRHFPDDVYMAMRLGQWVRDQLDLKWEEKEGEGAGGYGMGTLTMHMVSLHVFGGDMPKMRREYGRE